MCSERGEWRNVRTDKINHRANLQRQKTRPHPPRKGGLRMLMILLILLSACAVLASADVRLLKKESFLQ